MLRRTAKRMCTIGTAALALAVGADSLFAYATNGGIEAAKEQVSALEEEKARTEEALKELEGLKADTAAYVKSLDASLNQITEELSYLQGQIGAKEEEIRQAGIQLEAAKEQERSQYKAMKLRIKYMYEIGDTSFIDIVLNADSVAQMLNRAEYVEKIAEYDRKKLKEYGQTKDDIAAREESLQTERQELLGLQESTQAKQASVQAIMDSKEAELTAYNQKIAATQEEIAGYEEDIKAQEDLMRQIEAEMKRREEEEKKKAQEAGETYTVTNLGNISFKWPCPSSSRITSQFGDRESPTEGASSNHKGVDIGASTGADILAAAGGEVVISTYSYSAGNYIMIDHGGGVSTVYMHCSQLLVDKGEKVSQGQVIAKVGSTGYSTGPHLHFGVRSGGTYVNPLKYVSP